MEWILVITMFPTLHCSPLGCPAYVRQPVPTVEIKADGFSTGALCEKAALAWTEGGAQESWPVKWTPQAKCLRRR